MYYFISFAGKILYSCKQNTKSQNINKTKQIKTKTKTKTKLFTGELFLIDRIRLSSRFSARADCRMKKKWGGA